MNERTLLNNVVGPIKHQYEQNNVMTCWNLKTNHIIGELTLLHKDSLNPRLEGKVHMHDAAIFLDQTPIFEGYMVSCGFKNNYHWKHIFKRDLITCSNFDNHSKLKIQHNWERDEHDMWPFNEHENLHFHDSHDIHTSSKKLQGKWWWIQFGWTNHVLIACS